MKSTADHDERIAEMVFGDIYPAYVKKVTRKGRSIEELHEVLTWLTGYTEQELQVRTEDGSTFRQFFADATLNANAGLITGVICGYRVEDIENPLTQKARYMDKVVDELAKGRTLEKIKRKA